MRMMGNAGNPGSMPAADDETNSKRVMRWSEIVDVCRLFIFHNHNVTGYEDAACGILRRRCRRRSQMTGNPGFDWAIIEADLRPSLDTISEQYLCLLSLATWQEPAGC